MKRPKCLRLTIDDGDSKCPVFYEVARLPMPFWLRWIVRWYVKRTPAVRRNFEWWQ